jgi:prepilin-type N-terminal cleavage/methylation domain-containing protein
MLDLEGRTFQVERDARTHTLPRQIELKLFTAQSDLVNEKIGAIRFFPDGGLERRAASRSLPASASSTSTWIGSPAVSRFSTERPVRRHPMRNFRPMPVRGFSLLEVLVAFVILSLVATALFRLFSGALQNVSAADEYTRAVLVAESVLATAGRNPAAARSDGRTGRPTRAASNGRRALCPTTHQACRPIWSARRRRCRRASTGSRPT